MSIDFKKSCLSWAFAGTAGLASAATLTVPGDHPTISAALTAANPGDVIELTSNATTYSGNLYVTKNNITIQGQAGLVPSPKIQGVSAAHPLPAQGPQKWYAEDGETTSSNTWFDVHGAAIVNAASGLTLRNLIIASDPLQSRAVTASAFTAGCLDFRFGTGGLVQNCILDGKGPSATIGAERQVMTANNHVFDGVEFINGRVALESQGGTGTLEIKNSRIYADLYTLWLNGGNVSITSSTLDSRSASTVSLGCIIGNEYAESDVSFDKCVFRKSAGASANNGFVELRHHDRGAAFGVDSYNTGRYSPLAVGARFNQCDFVGNAPTQFNRVVSLLNGRTSWIVKTLRFTGCNFFNIGGNPLLVIDFPYPGNYYFAGGTVDRYEDYNVFKQAQNMAEAMGVVSGGHSITLAGDPLYVNATAGNFQLASNSPAATLRSPATPAYTGSQGVSATSVAAVKRTVGHTGATYTSINAAIAAAQSGDLIEIVDNSAPYIEDVYVANRNGITIQGAPSLNPRPRIQAPVTSDTVVRLASTTGRNITLRNLILDGSLLTLPNSMVLDLRDAGESVVENCEIIAGSGVSYGVFSQNTRILRNCKVTCAAVQPGIQQNISGNVALPNLHVESAGKAMVLAGGMFLISDGYVRGDGDDTINIGANTRSSYLDIRDSIVTSNATGAAATTNNLIVVSDVTSGRRTVVIDNSDLVGSLQGAGPNSPTGSGILVGGTPAVTSVTLMQITDSIFYNIAAHAIYLNNNLQVSTIPGLTYDPTLGFENYNAFKAAPNTLAAQGVTPGPNDLNLDSATLYVNAPTDFRLMASSPAATLNSTGTPAYAGSQGVAGSSVNEWTLY